MNSKNHRLTFKTSCSFVDEHHQLLRWRYKRESRFLLKDSPRTHIAASFSALVEHFKAVQGTNASDRNVFVMGLYDGMMNQTREIGQRLPARAAVVKLGRAKKRAVALAPGLNIHPYSIDLGKQIRFSVPLEHILAEMDNAVHKQLSADVKGALDA